MGFVSKRKIRTASQKESVVSERKEHFGRLVESLYGHFHESKQTSVNKLALLKLLYERMDNPERGSAALNKAYIAKFNKRLPKSKRAQNNRTIRSATNQLKKWIDEYYDRNPELPIRFRITDEYVLETIVDDGIKGKSVKELNDEIDELMQELGDCHKTISDIRAGKREPKHADQVANRFNCMLKFATRLNKLEGATRRRT